jgi:hypothetical protein
MMKKILTITTLFLLSGFVAMSQTIGKTKTEEYKADFEKKKDISAYLDYEGPQIPIQILKCGISDEVYEMYPELK